VGERVDEGNEEMDRWLREGGEGDHGGERKQEKKMKKKNETGGWKRWGGGKALIK
jgi:hypothetical protein